MARFNNEQFVFDIMEGPKQIDMGNIPFNQLIERNKYYVDKTLLIKDILSGSDSGVFLYTRPRRFGKTTNLSMLDAFFNIRYSGNTWFDGLAISKCHEFDGYRNRFPVIRLDMKGTKSRTYEGFIERMARVVFDAFEPFRYLLDSEMSKPLRDLFSMLDDLEVSDSRLESSIRMLCKALESYHGCKVIVLIDEYDSSVADAFENESHLSILDFLRGFLGETLKGNESLQMAYMTGVMQITKESIFSDLNNVLINNVFSDSSDERFGFTELEVMDILTYYGHPEKLDEVRRWYDGYRFGDTDVYNPFSIMNYVYHGFDPKPYWTNSGGDWIMRRLLERVNMDNFSDILSLLSGKSIRTSLSESLTFSRLATTDEALFSLMVLSGYLKAVPSARGSYSLSIVNKEVKDALSKLISEYSPVNTRAFEDFNRALLRNDAEAMTSSLRNILSVGSYHNLSTELHYEAVVMTVLYELMPRFEIRSEPEAGNGRVDIMLTPRRKGTAQIIIELKLAKTEDGLEEGAKDAIAQIHRKRYYLGMDGKVILIGIAFWKKMPHVLTETLDA